MAHSAAGKSDRKGITVIELGDMFPDEKAARDWFEGQIWPDGRHCPHCGSVRTHEASHAKSPYRCTDCRASYFSVKTKYDHAQVPASASQVGVRHLSRNDQPEGRIQPEAPPRYRYLATVRLVHAPPHPGSLGRTVTTGRSTALLRSMRPISAERKATSTRARSSKQAAARLAKPPSWVRRTARPTRSRPR